MVLVTGWSKTYQIFVWDTPLARKPIDQHYFLECGITTLCFPGPPGWILIEIWAIQNLKVNSKSKQSRKTMRNLMSSKSVISLSISCFQRTINDLTTSSIVLIIVALPFLTSDSPAQQKKSQSGIFIQFSGELGQRVLTSNVWKVVEKNVLQSYLCDALSCVMLSLNNPIRKYAGAELWVTFEENWLHYFWTWQAHLHWLSFSTRIGLMSILSPPIRTSHILSFDRNLSTTENITVYLIIKGLSHWQTLFLRVILFNSFGSIFYFFWLSLVGSMVSCF